MKDITKKYEKSRFCDYKLIKKNILDVFYGYQNKREKIESSTCFALLSLCLLSVAKSVWSIYTIMPKLYI